MPRKPIPHEMPRAERTEALRKRAVAASMRLPLRHPLYRHPKRKAFEEALLGGESVREVAKRFHLDFRNLQKYKSAYLAPLLNAAKLARNEAELERAMNFDETRARVLREQLRFVSEAKAADRWAEAAIVLGQANEAVRFVGEAERKIGPGSVVQQATPNAALQLGLIIAAPKYEEVYGPRSITEPRSASPEAALRDVPASSAPVPAPASPDRPSGDK